MQARDCFYCCLLYTSKLKDAMEKLDARFGKGTVIKASLMKKEPDTKEKDEKRR